MSAKKGEQNPNTSLLELGEFFSVDVKGPPKLLIPSVTPEEYIESICPDGYNKEFSSSSASVLIGQGINNNGGIQLVQVIGSKTPSYEDFSNRPTGVVHHKKTMLDGLLASTGLEAPTTSFKTFMEVSTKLLQLPVRKKDTPVGARSINGLPYYDGQESLYRISKLKKEPRKLKDIENTHGAVILNQLLNNKRKLRNFQWKQYYNDRSGNSRTNNLQVKLKSNIKEGAVMLDEEALIEEEKESQEKLQKAEEAKAIAAHQQVPHPTTGPGAPPPVAGSATSSQNPLDSIPEQISASAAGAPFTVAPPPTEPAVQPESEEVKLAKLKAEQEAKQQRITNRLKEQEARKDIKNHKRFIYENREHIRDLLKDTVVIEEEVKVQNLNYIPGVQNNQPPEVTKFVRKRRRPNANAVGHSNIRGVKPSYWK